MKDAHVNYTAYEGVEKVERFSDQALIDYCNDKIFSCDKYVSFFKKKFINHKLNVLEVGSGSGKLLYRLEKENILSLGVGYELSNSRCSFAMKFSNYMNSNLVIIRNQDFLKSKSKDEKFDVIIGIDVVINLIAATDENFLDKFFIKAIEKLKDEGSIILESITLQREIDSIIKSENGIYYTWKKFLDSDPFKYGLDEMSIDSKKNIIWKKFFIPRNLGPEEYFTNLLKPLSKNDFSKIAEKYSLKAEFFDYWELNDDTSDQEFIVILKKQ
jgi:hypothetical protein